MRIAFLIRALDYGGSEVQLLNLARGLRDRGHDILVVCMYRGGRLEGAYQDASIPVLCLEKETRWQTIGPTGRLMRMIRRWTPDVVHGYLSAGNLLSLIAKSSRSVTVVWGLRSSDIDLRVYGWWQRGSAFTERLLGRFADCIVVNSESARRHAAAIGFPVGRLEVIPNGIDTRRFQRDDEGRRRLRAEWGVSVTDKLVALVGRVDPVKGHPAFLRAAALLPDRSDLRFACIGDGHGEYAALLRQEADRLHLSDRLLWIPARSDMPEVYSAIDLLCSASRSESFPNVVAEAMACGTACVVTDVGDSARIVADTGTVVPRDDPGRLKEGIETSLPHTGDEAESRRRRLRIVDGFGLEKLVERTEALLRATVHDRKK